MTSVYVLSGGLTYWPILGMQVDGCHEKMMTDRVESDHLL